MASIRKSTRGPIQRRMVREPLRIIVPLAADLHFAVAESVEPPRERFEPQPSPAGVDHRAVVQHVVRGSNRTGRLKMLGDGADRLAEQLPERVEHAQLHRTAERVAVATARIFPPRSGLESFAQLNHLRPRVAIGGQLLGDRRGGQLLEATVRRLAGDVAPRHAFAPADRPVGKLAANQDVLALVAGCRGVREAQPQRQADDRRGELANLHEAYALTIRRPPPESQAAACPSAVFQRDRPARCGCRRGSRPAARSRARAFALAIE